MATAIRELMTHDPVMVDANTSIADVTKRMRDSDIGDVIVCEGDRVIGIVTDRDLAVRAVADARDPSSTMVGEIASRDVATVAPDDTVERAVQVMREHNIRRLPVVEDDRAVGIVSIGDLAIEQDPNSALADISAAPANN